MAGCCAISAWPESCTSANPATPCPISAPTNMPPACRPARRDGRAPARRHAAVRARAMYWLTGYDTFGFCFFQSLVRGADGQLALLTRSADLGQAQQGLHRRRHPHLGTTRRDATPAEQLLAGWSRTSASPAAGSEPSSTRTASPPRQWPQARGRLRRRRKARRRVATSSPACVRVKSPRRDRLRPRAARLRRRPTPPASPRCGRPLGRGRG